MEVNAMIVSCVVLAAFVVIYWCSTKVRFYTKLTVFLLFVVLFIPTVFIPFALLLRPKDARNYGVIMFTLRCLSKVFGIKYNIQGLENVKKEEPMIVVSNHQSEIDIMALGHLWPVVGTATTIMKRSLMFAGPYGLASYLCDSVYVDRSNPTKARESLNNSVDYLTKKKIKIWIFPEGTCSETGTMLPLKKGAFHMAIQAQVPILPIIISSYSSFFATCWSNKPVKFENGGKVNIKILPPIPTVGLTKDDIDPLITSLRKSMQDTFDSISGFKTDKECTGNSSEKTHITADMIAEVFNQS